MITYIKRLTILFLFTVAGLYPSFAQNTLFKKYKGNPIIEYGPSQPAWRTVHNANAAILKPEHTSDGTWRMYIRGNGEAPNYGGQIGLLTQDTVDFAPYGPWIEYEHNPLLKYGIPGSYDEKGLLDCSPVLGENDVVYFYYKGKCYDKPATLAGAISDDGGYSFEKFDNNPLLVRAGINDAVFHNNRYYIFYGLQSNPGKAGNTLDAYLKITSDPKNLKDVDSVLVVPAGGGPDNFDSKSVHGTRVFRLQDRWYLVYQGSNVNIDFPHRFHAAYSDDLIHWTKVDNDFPLMTRGSWGEWDQGAIWYGEVFEYRDTLYMLYEGWGCRSIPKDRDQPYFYPGHSRTGIARVPVEDFLYWVEGGFDSSWVTYDFGPDGIITDFEEYTRIFYPTHGMSYEVVANPDPDELNASSQVGKIITTPDMWELLWSEPFAERFDFSEGATFSMDIYSEVTGDVYLKLEHPTNYNLGQIQVKKQLSVTNTWVEMEFDFSSLQPKSDQYGKIVLLFDGGGTAEGKEWYFDNLRFESIPTKVIPLKKPRKTHSLKILYDSDHNRIKLDGLDSQVSYTVFSITGVALKQGNGNTVDISDLKRGIYIIYAKGSSAKFIR